MYEDIVLNDGPPHFKSEIATSIYEAWKSFIQDGEKIPKRINIDPLAIPPKLLPFIWIYEYVEDLDSYRQN